MAIYSLSHSSVGRSTHEAGTAGAHARYITRDGAVALILGEHMPLDRRGSQAWLDAQEATDRKNARVIDRVLLALPVELDAGQRADLVRDFAAEVTGGRIPWMAGIHDRDEDAHNPHAHVIFRDRDIETGKRAAQLSEKGSTDRIRETWERMANAALERAGIDARIDRRSLVDQGIDRQAGIHVGAGGYAMEEKGVRPISVALETEKGRVINWPEIDQGRTRAEYQREIERGNLERDRDRGKTGHCGAALVPVAVIEPEPTREIAIADPQPVFSAPDLAGEKLPAPSLAPAMPPSEISRQRPGPSFLDRIKEPARKPEPLGPVLGGMDVPARQPEAPQRGSYEVESSDLKAERSKLVGWIASAREKLADLADRLESAFGRIMDRPKRPDDTARRQAETPAAPAKPRSVAEELIAAGRLRRQQRPPEPEKQPEKDKTRSIWDEFQHRKKRRPEDPGP